MLSEINQIHYLVHRWPLWFAQLTLIFDYYVGEKCLIWAERILAKKLLKSGILKIKLSKFWRIGTVTKALGQHYMVQTEDGKLRHVHRRQMKPYPDSAP